MIIAADNVRATVRVTENIVNHPVYSNSTTRTIMVDNSVSIYKKIASNNLKVLPSLFNETKNVAILFDKFD